MTYHARHRPFTYEHTLVMNRPVMQVKRSDFLSLGHFVTYTSMIGDLILTSRFSDVAFKFIDD